MKTYLDWIQDVTNSLYIKHQTHNRTTQEQKYKTHIYLEGHSQPKMPDMLYSKEVQMPGSGP